MMKVVSGKSPLPPGQHESDTFPRFGLGRFARHFPTSTKAASIEIRGDVRHAVTVDVMRAPLPRVEQVSDFHCVTTWSRRDVRWAGIRFADFYREIVRPQAAPADDATVVVFHGQDGYRCAMQLEDLLHDDVLLADTLDGRPLGFDHGTPLRLVAPAHYGYKNVKHLAAISFWCDRRRYSFPFPYPALMDHPRARVAFEERGRGLPGWVFRLLYRPLIGLTVRNFRNALATHRRTAGSDGERTDSDRARV